MAFDSNSCFSISVIVLYLTTAASLFLLTNGASPLVDNVCRQTRNPDLCTAHITSDPRSSTAPLAGLADVAIQLAGYRAAAIKLNIHDALIRTADPVLKGRYVTCENLYLDALDSLNRVAPGESEAHQYGALSQLGVQVAGKIDGCEAAFGNNSPFKLGNQVVAVLAEAIAVIARSL